MGSVSGRADGTRVGWEIGGTREGLVGAGRSGEGEYNRIPPRLGTRRKMEVVMMGTERSSAFRGGRSRRCGWT